MFFLSSFVRVLQEYDQRAFCEVDKAKWDETKQIATTPLSVSSASKRFLSLTNGNAPSAIVVLRQERSRRGAGAVVKEAARIAKRRVRDRGPKRLGNASTIQVAGSPQIMVQIRAIHRQPLSEADSIGRMLQIVVAQS